VAAPFELAQGYQQAPARAVSAAQEVLTPPAVAFLRETGLDPSAMEGRPILQPSQRGGPLEEAVMGLTTPENLVIAPALASPFGRMLFMGQTLGQAPQSAQAVAEAKIPEERKEAAIQAALSFATAAALGRTLSASGAVLPQATQAAIQRMLEREEIPPLPERPRAGLQQAVEGVGQEQAATEPEHIVSAAYRDQHGAIHTGANHVQILNNLGIPGFETAESRNTPQFGYLTDRGRFIDRVEAGPVSEAALQNLKEFEPGEKVHSDEVESRASPTQALGDVPQEPKIVGLGGAAREEIPETGAGGEKYGIARTVREERAQAGQVTPTEPGQGVITEETIQQGRALNAQNPQLAEQMLSAFEADPDKATSEKLFAVTRAHGEQLAREARQIEERFGTESDEFKSAKGALDKWDERTNQFGAPWHRQGMAQQGWTDLDTGSFVGLSRYQKEQNKREFTSEEKPQAVQIAGQVRQAEQQTGQAAQAVHAELERTVPATTRATMRKAEQDALDAAWKTVREHAVRVAESETKARVASEKTQREAAAVQAGAERKALAAATKQARDLASKTAREERKRLANPAIPVWEKAREYLDKGIISYNDLLSKVSTDLGMSLERTVKLLAGTKKLNTLTVDLLNKQARERALKAKAQLWVMHLDDPWWSEAVGSVPKGMFRIRVGFHGTVAMGTHAPAIAFMPKYWDAYFDNYMRMYRMAAPGKGGLAYYEQQVQNQVRKPYYKVANDAGLDNNPFQYEEFNNPEMSAWLSKQTGMGNRGYFALKLLRQDLFDQEWSKLPKSAQIPQIAQSIAKSINHLTGSSEIRPFKGAHLAAFAPKLELSRAQFLFGDPWQAVKTAANWKKATPGEKDFALRQVKDKAWIAGTMLSLLGMNAAMLAAVGSKQKINFTNPFRSDWLKFKAAGFNISYGNPMITMIRLPIRLGVVATMPAGKLASVIYPDENAWNMIGQYARSQESPFASLVTDLTFREDYQGRQLPFSTRPEPKRLRAQGIMPYTWTEYGTQQLLPIPFQEGAREVWRNGLGMSDKQIEQAMKALLVTAAMGMTGGRFSEDRPYQSNK